MACQGQPGPDSTPCPVLRTALVSATSTTCPRLPFVLCSGTLDVLIHKGHPLGASAAGAAAAGGAAGAAAAGTVGGPHRLDPLKLLPIVRSVARGMLHLHTRRPAILHRDLKPGNLFLGGWVGGRGANGRVCLSAAWVRCSSRAEFIHVVRNQTTEGV